MNTFAAVRAVSPHVPGSARFVDAKFRSRAEVHIRYVVPGQVGCNRDVNTTLATASVLFRRWRLGYANHGLVGRNLGVDTLGIHRCLLQHPPSRCHAVDDIGQQQRVRALHRSYVDDSPALTATTKVLATARALSPQPRDPALLVEVGSDFGDAPLQHVATASANRTGVRRTIISTDRLSPTYQLCGSSQVAISKPLPQSPRASSI